MNGQHFYLTLPSDSSMNLYPSNTLSEFSVNLPHSIDLTGDWEVALKEIQYPRSWNNVPSRKNHFYVRKPSATSEVYIVEAGYYSDVPNLLKGIMQALPSGETRKAFDMTFNPISRHVTVTTKKDYSIGFVKELAAILGFDSSRDTWLSGKTTASNVTDLEGPLRTLFVYSDVIDAQMVGDTRVPLLRIVNVEGKDGKTIIKTFQDPLYFPVSRKSIDRIEINIRDGLGDKVPFESGRVIVQLHFRQCRPVYL